MKTAQAAGPFSECAKVLSLSALFVCGSLILTSGVARADTVFDLNATIGDIVNTSTPSSFGYTGSTATGTITINTTTGTVDGIDVTVQNDSNVFINVLACSTECTFTANSGFAEYGILDLGTTLAGFTGGSLASGSWIYLDNQGLGQGGPGTPYSLSGSLTPATLASFIATPEPAYYAASLGLVLIGALVAVRRRSSGRVPSNSNS
jgi:hypothetical protein